MAFIYEVTSQDDIEKFQLNQLINTYLNDTAEYDQYWIVDYSSSSWLIPIKELRDTESLWILHYKNTNIEIKLVQTYKGEYDLISIASNSFDKIEIASTIQDALYTLSNNAPTYPVKKEKKTLVNEQTNFSDSKQKKKRKISYLDISLALIAITTLFFIINEKKKNILSVLENNNTNKSANTSQQTKLNYDIYATSRTKSNINEMFGIDLKNINTRTKIFNFSSHATDCKADKDGNIYWINNSTKAIYKANQNGTNVKEIISLSNDPRGIAIDNKRGKIFWIQYVQDKKHSELFYADLDGTDQELLVSNKNLMKSGRGMFYDYIYDKLYIADQSGHQIISVDIPTKDVKRVIYTRQPSQLVIDYKNDRIIWSDTVTDNISSCDFYGSNKKVLIQFDDKFSNPDALTIDTINNHLIYEYFDLTSSASVLETSNLDGTQRKIIQKVPHNDMHTLFFTHQIDIKNIHKQKIVTNTQNVPSLKVCFACHGQSYEKSALGKSMIVKDMTEDEIYKALIGYKNGTYGGPMRGVMKAQVSKYSNQELKNIAHTIKSQ